MNDRPRISHKQSIIQLTTLLFSVAALGSSPAIAQSPPPANSSSETSSTVSNSNENPSILASYYNYRDYEEVVRQTASMVGNADAQSLAQQYGLNILDITWEDTGRYYNSAVGPNISDMTIQVQQHNPISDEYKLSLMPVIRHPNFSDESADVPLDRFFLLVGNEKNQDLKRVSLREFLGDLRGYLHEPESWAGEKNSLLADRDTHVLVSAQACFLPIPQGSNAKFNPVLFNYQSYQENPAVLTILATREGTSVTIIDNVRDGFEAGMTWGQRLFFNQNGERASFTGQRLSDFQGESGDVRTPTVEAAGEEGLNMVMLIQVPLKQKEPLMPPAPIGFGGVSLLSGEAMAMPDSNVEAAVIGHGEIEGPFTEIDNLAIERDPDFPIRVTVQFYKATSNGVVSQKDMQDIREQIDRVYEDADYVGSLVVDGPSNRPTEYDGSKLEPPNWWDEFWKRHEENTGQSREEALEMLRRLRGENWMPRSPQELQEELDRL
ncbi:MAG TPA: hypothetical protein IGS17_03085 [Oscillatoriales cyanobacterium M59_W2019_021]|nr:hypothetical protein [Oscillatoriales cyanobacterium M4454_W2019_049]HIK49897.1 hypothetical protein [Oscillatoriales cyanobacterium M59_W2019_021]